MRKCAWLFLAIAVLVAACESAEPTAPAAEEGREWAGAPRSREAGQAR
jgi:hypothetical protein